MKSALQKGKLTIWKDDRGFGFIKADRKSDGDSQEVFLHISALQGSARRPKVGDTILYEEVTESKGKIRATRATIQGVVSRSVSRPTSQPTSRSAHPFLSTKRQQRQQGQEMGSWFTGVVGIVTVSAIALFKIQFSPSRLPPLTTAITQPNCTVKGNISLNSGNKLYHLPGMEDYENTVIDPGKGEKWFCTEAEAIASGWRKAPN